MHGHAWSMHGPCNSMLKSDMAMHGPCMDHCMGLAWTMHGFAWDLSTGTNQKISKKKIIQKLQNKVKDQIFGKVQNLSS